MYLIASYSNNPRKLKKLIIAILKQNLATSIKRLNYIKNYCLDKNWQIKKEEIKILIIQTSEDKAEELNKFLNKNWFEVLFYVK